jgi:hypothetical protein
LRVPSLPPLGKIVDPTRRVAGANAQRPTLHPEQRQEQHRVGVSEMETDHVGVVMTG